jgi:putative phage-type endonuclease
MTDRDEWLERRRQGIGGSDVAALMGLSPWTSPYALWCDKVGLLAPDDATEAMEFGNRVEPVLTRWFQDRTGLEVHGEQMECARPDEPWMRCTVDGFVMESTGTDNLMDDALGVAEWKSTGDAPWDEIPAYYQCQGQWNMAVTNMPHVWFGVLHMPFGRPTFRVYELARDEADIELLTKTARAFWHDHVLTGVPPETDGSTATTEALAAAWDADDDAELIEADLSDLSDVAVLAATKADAKALEVRIAELENRLKARMAEATAIVDGYDDKGRPIVIATWKAQTADRFDSTSFRKAWPDLAADFTKTTESRVFRLKTPKGNT